jgi:hypothetical protein
MNEVQVFMDDRWQLISKATRRHDAQRVFDTISNTINGQGMRYRIIVEDRIGLARDYIVVEDNKQCSS